MRPLVETSLEMHNTREAGFQQLVSSFQAAGLSTKQAFWVLELLGLGSFPLHKSV